MHTRSAISINQRLWLLLFAMSSAAIVYIPTTRFGAGLSPDSVGYIAAARNILTGQGFTAFDGSPFISQPPLYPALLAVVGKLTGADPVLFANVLNAFLMGVIVFLSGSLALSQLRLRPIYVFTGLVAVSLSAPLISISMMAWSEPLFICFGMMSLILAHSYRENNTWQSLILFSLSTACSMLTRYSGVAFLLWGSLLIYLTHAKSLKARIKDILVFIIISGLPLAIWLIRNYIVSNTFFGPRSPSTFPLWKNLGYTIRTLSMWFSSLLKVYCIGAGLLAILCIKNKWRFLNAVVNRFTPIASFILIYLLFIIISSSITSYDPIGDRLLSPLYVPIILLLLLLAEAFVETYANRLPKHVLFAFLFCGLLIWQARHIPHVIEYAANQYQNGIELDGREWKASQTLQFLSAHRTDTYGFECYSNFSGAVYYLADIKAKSTKNKSHNKLQFLESLSSERPALLIWFNKIQSHPSIEEIQAGANTTLIAGFNDGAIYRVTRK